MSRIRKGSLILFVLLYVFWMLLSPEAGVIEMVVGLLAVMVVIFYSRDMIFDDKELPVFRARLLWLIPATFFTLLKAMVKANLQVAKIVLSPKMPLSAEFKTVRQPVKRDVTRAFYATAITLTPGTLVVDVKADHLLVHCLTKEAGANIEGGKVETAFKRLEAPDHD